MKSTLFSHRLEGLKARLFQEDFDCLLIENPIDLYYFTGLDLSAGRLVIHSAKSQLFVDGRYLQIAEERAALPVAGDGKGVVAAFLKELRVKRAAFDGAHTRYDRFLQLNEMEGIEWISSTSLFSKMRMIKDAWEIAKMRECAQLLWKGYEWIVSSLEKGVTERELSKGFEIFCLEQGADSLSFDPIVAFGKNSAMPHYRSQNVPLCMGDIVLIDIGIVCDHYHSDMTRVHFYGEKDPTLERLYKIAERAAQSARELCLPGISCGELDRVARAVMREEGVEDLFVHSLGHGIGLETHEYPRIKYDSDAADLVLEPGMVFTVEPGLYMPGVGGVRYEDTVVITPEGHENFYPLGAK